MRWGCDVYLQPTHVDVPFPPDILPLLLKPLEPPFDLIINHWDPSNISIAEPARRCTRLAVAWSMWEFAGSPGYPDHLDKEGNPDPVAANPGAGFKYFRMQTGTMRKRLKWYDLVLGYDQVTLDAFDPYLPKHVARGVLQGGYEAGHWRPAERDWHGDRFGFIMHGALNSRKVPFLTVEAFRTLKEEQPGFAGATLSLHTVVPGLFTEMNDILEPFKIRVFYEIFSDQVLQSFYKLNHCLLAPSRGEGKDLPALEMMSTGGVVAASNFGGHTGWMSDQYAYPLDYQLGPTFQDKLDGPHDARVSVETLKDAMWHVYTHRSEAREKGAIAARTIPSMCDWSVVVEDLFRRIRDLCPHNGSIIYDMAQRCRVDPLTRTDEPEYGRPSA